MFDAFYKHRKKFIVLIIFLVAASIYFLTGLKVDNSFDIWFVEDDPVIQQYNIFTDNFGNDEIVITSVSYPDSVMVHPTTLEKLRDLEIGLLDIDGVERVTTLFRVAQIANALDDPAKLKWIIRHTVTAKRFCTIDLSTLFIYTTVERSLEIDRKRPRILAQVDSTITHHFNQGQIRHTGTGVILNALNETVTEQALFFVPLSYLLILLICWYYIRSLRWIMLILVTVLFVNLIVFAVMAVSEQPVTMITIAIPLLILIVSVANIMHYARAVSEAGSQKQDSLIKFKAILKPSFFNALTTSGGFLSLVLASMPITRNYGAFAALGVFLSFLLSALLTMFLVDKGAAKDNFKEHYLEGIWNKISRRPLLTMSIFAVFVVCIVPGFFNLNTDTNSLEFLPDNHPVKTDSKVMQQNSGNFLPLDFIIITEKDTWKDPLFLKKLKKMSAAVIQNTDADAFFSIADVVYDLNSLSSYLQPAQDRQDSRIKAAIISAEFSGASNRFVQDGMLRITCLLPIGSAGDLWLSGLQIVNEMENILGERYPIQQAGYLPIYNRLIDYLIEDQVKSLTIAFFVILLLMFLFLRSPRLLLVAMVVNVMPIIGVFAFMGYWKINLDIATITVAPAMIGIIVDDTLHLLHKIQNNIRDYNNIADAIKKALAETGAALMATSIVLAAGFAVLVFASSSSIAHTGLLIVVTTILAIITDIILLPVLVYILYRKS